MISEYNRGRVAKSRGHATSSSREKCARAIFLTGKMGVEIARERKELGGGIID